MVQIKLIKTYFDASATELTETFLFPNFARLSYSINSPVTPAPLPEERSDENVLIKVEGNSSQITISWKLKDESSNRFLDNSQTERSNTALVHEQLVHFKDFFVNKSIDDSYRLQIEYPGNTVTWDGSITKMMFNTDGAETLTFNATIDFIEGRVFTVYEIDAPTKPLNFTVTKNTTTSFDASWTTPFDAGSSAINDYVVYYRLPTSGSWSTSVTTSSPITVGSLSSGQKYLVKVRARSDVGVGEPSILITVDLA